LWTTENFGAGKACGQAVDIEARPVCKGCCRRVDFALF
jgi:hypothetical protein